MDTKRNTTKAVSEHAHDQYRHLNNQEYTVLLGMNYGRAEQFYNSLVRAGYGREHAVKLVRDCFHVELIVAGSDGSDSNKGGK